MLKSALLKKTICITTIFSFALANLPRTAGAYGYRLTPESFDEMYYLAQSGRVEALRSSINRGLNIDVMNADGDTGLCVAARRHDSYTYNAFRAAGANPRHPCTQNIDDYDDFIASSRAVPVTSTPRAAYGTIGREKYSVSPSVWWWIGGAALVGGILALVLGGGGGGGGGGSSEPAEDYNSLGSTAGTKGTVRSTADAKSLDNSSYVEMKNSKTEEISNIKFNTSILSYTDYLDVALRAVNGGSYTNTTDTVLKIGEGIVGMVATKKSYIDNFGFINVDSNNASIGMVASEGSTASNQGRGIISGTSNNGIAINFSGNKEDNTLIGMYADTKSTLENYGDIKGTAIEAVDSDNVQQSGDESGLVNPYAGESTDVGTGTSAASGTLVGMEAMIVNAGKDLNKDTINMLNESSGKINLSAGDAGASESDIKVSLIGMGSFLDYGFMNGAKNINRAEKVQMYNYGDITIGYTGNYVASSENSLRKGTGGLVGMRADANTSARNLSSINLNLEEYSSGSENIDVSAGMQSIHGGNLSNSGTISISTSAGNKRKNYGMLSVEGSGSVSGLYTDLNQTLENSGNISVKASNSFGIASFNGGNLSNSGNITLGKVETTTQYEKNIAMYAYGKSKESSMENTGSIDIYSHDSIAMQNDFAGGTSIYNKGIINVHESATDSYVFGGAYSEAHNSNTINYEANSTGDTSSEGIKYDPFSNYKLSIGNSIISTQSRSVLGETSETSSSTTEKIYNDENSVINMQGSSYVSALSVEADDSGETQGKAFNNGKIVIEDSIYGNATNTVGMYLGKGSINNAYIINNGSISTDSRFSAAMASESTKNASMINNGSISADKKYSLGMYSNGLSNTMNNKDIAMNGDNNVGIYVSGSTGKSLISNSSEATVTIGNKNTKTENSYGIYIADSASATVENNGTIDTYTKEAGAGIYSKGSDVTIENSGVVNANGSDAYGIYASGKADIKNNETAVINVGKAGDRVSNSYGIYNEAEGEISNKGTINLYNTEENESYAIYSTGNSEVTNEGTINLNGENSTAIYAESGKIINKNTINIDYDNINGLKSSKSAEVINDTTGIINVGKASKSVSNSNGMLYVSSNNSSSDEGNLTNKGTINLYGTENGNSHAVSIEAKATFDNSNVIHSYNGYSSAVYIAAEATVTNSGEITVEGSNVYAVQSIVTSTGGQSVDGFVIGYGGDDIDYPTGSLTFRNSGRITVGTSSFSGDTGYGVFAREITSLINNGIFVVYNSNSYAIYAESGSLIENNSSITMNGKNSTAIYGGEVTTLNNNGQIVLNKEAGKGLYTTGSGTINNNNTLTLLNGNGSYGIYATGEAVINNSQNGIITVGQNSTSAANGNGIYAPSAASITNNAQMYLYASGTAITGGNNIVNTGNLSIAQNNSKGIYSNGTSVENSGVIRILTSGNNYGIYSEETISINNTGNITLGTSLNSAGNDFGIYALNASDIFNGATITVYTSGAAITGGNNITNTARLKLHQEGSKGIVSNGTSIQNSGIIELSLPEGSYGIQSTGNAVITNTDTGQIIMGDSSTVSSVGAYGIYALNASSITNAATINVYATSSYGIEGGTTDTISNSGNINMYNNNNTGISSNGNSNISNNKNITITGATNSYGIKAATAAITNGENGVITIGASNVSGGSDNYGIYSSEGTIANNGSVYIYGSGYGIYGQAASSITNSGIVMLKNTGSTGIYTASANITNSGVINMMGETATGIYSDGDGLITNTSGATIRLVSGSAIYVNRNTQVVNDGIINVSSSGYGINNALSVNNGGSISLGSGTAINARGTVTNDGSISIKGSGIAVQGSSLNNSGDIEVDNTLITAAVSVSGAVINSGTITVVGTGTAVENATSLNNNNNISVGDGTAVKDVREITNEGTIKTSSGTAISGASVITNSGGTIMGTTYAVNGGTELLNEAGSTISISSGTAAVNGVSTVVNNGKIEVTGSAMAAIYGATNVDNQGSIIINNGHGIYTKNPGVITNSGSITVKSGNGNGIYVVVPTVSSTVTITNTGIINVANGYAIYVEKNYSLNTETVTEGEKTGTKYTDNTSIDGGSAGVTYGGSCGQHCRNGEIVWDDGSITAETSSLIVVSDRSLLSNIRLINTGQISVNGNIDFGSAEEGTSVASIGKNGTYEASSFSGTVLADSSLVEDGFETVYVNENAFKGEDNGLNIVSQSYLFNAALINSDSRNIGVVMTMSSFDDKVGNSRIAQFLTENYQAQKGENIFNVLKLAENKSQFDDYLNKELGFNIIPNLARQSLDVEKTVNKEINDDLMTKTTDTNRYKVNVLAYKNNVGDYHEISGYKDNVIAAYGYQDKAVNRDWRIGFTLAAIRYDSKFNDDSTRYNNMLELSAPIIFGKDNLSAMLKPKAGFARGHYRRNAVNQAYKANTKEVYYGFDSALRRNIDFDFAAIEPNAAFNLTGLYNDDIKENKDGLKIKDDNTLSALASLGLDIKKKFSFNKDNALSLIFGGKYYHEFGDKYEAHTTIGDMIGNYDITDDRMQRNYGLLTLKALYDYKQFSIAASVNTPLEKKYKPYYMFNLGYNF